MKEPQLKMQCLDVGAQPFRLVILALLPSGNQLMRWYNGSTFRRGGRVIRSKYRYTKEKNLWRDRVYYAVYDAGLQDWRPSGRVRVNFEVHRPGTRPLDPTNAQVAVDKMIIDCLVREHKILKDDSHRFLEWGKYTPVRCPKGQEKVIIELEVIRGGND